MKCSICNVEIEKKYCTLCGQRYIGQKLTLLRLINDAISNIFALDGKLLINVKSIILTPRKFVMNYWQGFRGYYYSPFRFFMVALFALMINYYFTDNFFIFKASTNGISKQFFVLTLFITLISISSYITYIFKKKTFAEHLILSIYSTSLWIIIFVPITIVNTLYLKNYFVDVFGFLSYFILIILWNNLVFEMKFWQRVMMILFHFIVLSLILLSIFFLIDYFFGDEAINRS